MCGLFAQLDRLDLDFQLFLKAAVAIHEELIEDVWEFYLHGVYVVNQKHEQLATDQGLNGETSRKVLVAAFIFRELGIRDLLVENEVHVPKVVSFLDLDVDRVVEAGEHIARYSDHEEVYYKINS